MAVTIGRITRMIAKMDLINENIVFLDNQHSHQIPFNAKLFLSKLYVFKEEKYFAVDDAKHFLH